MKSSLKLLFFLVFLVFLASCGGDKSVYGQYSDSPDDGNKATTDNDITNGKDDENNISDSDIEIADDKENPDNEEAVPTTDEENDTDEDITDDDDTKIDDNDNEPKNCTGFSLDPDQKLHGSIPDTTYTTKIAGNILGDSNIADLFELRLDHKRFDGDPFVAAGTYDLSDGDSWHNTNNWSCWECVLVIQDYLSDSKKIYFQKEGTLTIESVDEEYNFKGTLSAVLVESTIDEWVSYTVENGDCIEIETSFEAETFYSSECSGENPECSSNRDCDPGYYCGNDCHCYIENPED